MSIMMNVYRDVDYHDQVYGDDECDHIDYSVSVICIHSMRIGLLRLTYSLFSVIESEYYM